MGKKGRVGGSIQSPPYNALLPIQEQTEILALQYRCIDFTPKCAIGLTESVSKTV